MRVRDLGCGVDYAAGMEVMRKAMAAVDVDGPVLLLLEHAPVVTVTRQHGLTSLLTSPAALAADGIGLVETDRGGDVTFHGPGQLVGYPVVRLSRETLRADLVAYVRDLEDGLVQACRRLGVPDAHTVAGKTGVWTAQGKVCAIGVGVGRGVTRHGFALNVDVDLERYIRHLTPCGLVDDDVTTLARVLGRPVARADVVAAVVAALGDLGARAAPRALGKRTA